MSVWILPHWLFYALLVLEVKAFAQQSVTEATRCVSRDAIERDTV